MGRKYIRKSGAKVRLRIVQEELDEALKEVKNGASVQSTAKKYSINRTTLGRIIKRGAETYPSCQHSKVFKTDEEQELASYILDLSQLNHGLTMKKFKELAFQYAKANQKKFPQVWTDKEEAGREWCKGFLERNNKIALRKPEPTSLARGSAFNKHTVSIFFEKLRRLMEKHSFTADRIWNVDETGLTTVHKPPKVLASKGAKQVSQVTSGERGQLVTLCSAINAVGNQVPPFLIFPRVHWIERMAHNAPAGTTGAADPSGWMTGANFVKYMEHFLKHVPCSKENPHLLIYDNHDSHITVAVVELAKSRGVVLLTIPPHTSHKTQPLDRTVFGPLKHYYNTAASDWMSVNPGKNLSIYDIPGLLSIAYPKAFTIGNIVSGFRATGIWPFNSQIFTDDEYASSIATDRPAPDEVLQVDLACVAGLSNLNETNST